MPGEVSCSSCGAPLHIPEGVRARWVECPRCHERVVNPHALRINGPVRLTGTGVLGTLLLLMGICGSFWGCGLNFAERYKAAMGRQEPESHGIALIICCVFFFASGLMLLRAGSDRVRRPLLLLAAGFAVLAAVTLLIASGLIVLFATCLVGR